MSPDAIQRDVNRIPIQSNEAFLVKKQVSLVAPGAGAQGATKLFNVTGDVIATLIAVCSEDLVSAGGGTLEVGITGNTAALIAQTTATAIDNGEVWVDSSPATVENKPAEKILTGGPDIYQTVGTADITAGTITYYCLFRPLSADGTVTPA